MSLEPDNLANLDIPFEEAVIRDIEKAAVACEANIIIIDNISILCMQMEKGDDAAKLVQNLRALKNKYGFSILIIVGEIDKDDFKGFIGDEIRLTPVTCSDDQDVEGKGPPKPAACPFAP